MHPFALVPFRLVLVCLPALLFLGCDSSTDRPEREMFFGVAVERTGLDIGDSVNGILDPSDPRALDFVGNALESILKASIGDSSRVNVYRIQSEGPTELQITSPDFTSFFALLDESGTVVRLSGNGLAKPVQAYTALERKTYYAVVSSFREGATGTYTLSSRRPDVVPLGVPTEQSITRDSRVTGTLETTDARLGDLNEEILDGYGSGFFIDAYSLSGTGAVTVDVASDAFDAGVLLISNFGTFVASDNDGGTGDNARLSFTLGEDERVYILVSSFSEGETGPYTLSVSDEAALRIHSVAPANTTPSYRPSK